MALGLCHRDRDSIPHMDLCGEGAGRGLDDKGRVTRSQGSSPSCALTT